MSEEKEQRLAGCRIQERYCAFLRHMVVSLQSYPFLKKGVDELESVAANVVKPFNVAVFGRMKTGKSTLINALIGRILAITGVEESTATINKFTYADGEQLKTFTVHWKGDLPRSFPIKELQRDWSGTGADVLERVSRVDCLELYSDATVLKDIHIIDTPGTGSTAKEHENAAQQFISGQDADALVYVFSPVGRETDEEALDVFRKGCLSGSSPYNSVAILHKWDHIYWDNGGDEKDIQAKADRLYEAMCGMVAAVIPVSAPLALFVKCAEEDFWQSCLTILSEVESEEELIRDLGRDSKWDKILDRQILRQHASKYDLPWSSFQILLRHLYRKKPVESNQARLLIWELSGMGEFEDILDRHFFKQAAIIRQRQTRARAQNVFHGIYDRIAEALKAEQSDIDMMEKLEKEVSDPDVMAWLARKKFSSQNVFTALSAQWQTIDRAVIQTSQARDREDDVLELIRWLDTRSDIFSSEQQVFLRKVLGFLEPIDSKTDWDISPSDRAIFIPLFKHVAALCALPDNRTRQYSEKLRNCLVQVALTSDK